MRKILVLISAGFFALIQSGCGFEPWDPHTISESIAGYYHVRYTVEKNGVRSEILSGSMTIEDMGDEMVSIQVTRYDSESKKHVGVVGAYAEVKGYIMDAEIDYRWDDPDREGSGYMVWALINDQSWDTRLSPPPPPARYASIIITTYRTFGDRTHTEKFKILGAVSASLPSYTTFFDD